MKLTLGFSPCPNDTFIFDALVNGKIDTEGLHFEAVLEDIETLNKWASENHLHITKLSFPAFFQNIEKYIALPSGAALGNGVGPLLVAREMMPMEKVDAAAIAIPGENTTANFLLSFAFPKATNRFPVLFSEIEETVLSGKSDLGLLIHENRFTYQQKGLTKILDLGAYWEQETGLPIPLACIAISRDIDVEIQQKVGHLIRKSVEYAFSQYPFINDYIKSHAQAMDEDVMRSHIELYVNNFSIDLGVEGQKAIRNLHEIYNAGKSNNKVDSADLFIRNKEVVS
jgi:1,4-dihydroxy-6-naphthoate synthase